MRVGETDISRRKRGILLNRVLEMSNALVDIGSTVPFAQGEPALEVTLVDFGRDGPRSGQPGMFLAGDGDLDFSRDGFRDVALQSERIAHFAIVGFGPEVLISGGANQLRVHPDVVALSNH